MPKLILKRKSEIIDEFVLDDSKSSYTIGSDTNNDFIISDKKVSMQHIKIENINDSFYLEDLKSAFGTQLNGRPLLNRAQIVHEDEISIGDLTLVFDNKSKTNLKVEMVNNNDEIEIIDDDDFEDAISFDSFIYSNPNIIQDQITSEIENSVAQTYEEEFYEVEEASDDNQRKEFEARAQKSSNISSDESYYLLAIYGPYLGKKYALKFGDTRIGRDIKLNDIILRKNEKGELDPSISRRHATVSYKNGRFFVTDKRSKTRTYVNQIKLSPTDEVPINVGDEIEIVSDQKSTIFRLVVNDQLDFALPKKAGIWWIRNNHKLGTTLSIILCIIALWVLGHSIKNRVAINKKPKTLKVIEEMWYQTHDKISIIKNNGISKNTPIEIGNLALADLTGNKTVDIIFSDFSGNLLALEGESKKIIWVNKDIGVQSSIPIVLADLNENSLVDVLVVGNDSRLRALDGSNGAEIWLSPILGESLSGPPIVCDLDGDGLQDILICSKAGQIHLGYGDIYTMNWKTIDTGLAIHSVPSTWDLEGDSNSQAFLGTEEGKVLIINGATGKIAKVFDFNEGLSKATGNLYQVHGIRNPVALADMNQNKVMDLLVSSTTGNYLAVDSKSLTHIWHEQLPLNSDLKADNLAPALGDVNGDKMTDVVLVSNQLIKIIKGSADPKNRKQVLWEFSLDNQDAFVTPVTLADVNKDKSNDIIIGSKFGTIYILNGKNGQVIAQINNEGNPPISPLIVADIGGDSFLDIILMRKDLNIYKIQTNCSIQKNSVVWGQIYSDAQHTGKLNYISPKALSYNLSMTASGILLFGVIILNVAARKKRQLRLERNQRA
ncbi:MAG: FHA domain-containing protein [bacterium]